MSSEETLRAWKGADRYEPRAQLSGWLHTIATNVCLPAIAPSRRAALILRDVLSWSTKEVAEALGTRLGR